MSDQNHDDPDDKVGYGKPPRETRFRKGKSGNPRGRPPKIEPSRSEMQQMLDFFAVAEQPVTITMNGKRLKIPGYRAIIMKLMQQALSGEKHSMALYIGLHEKFMAAYSAANPDAKRMIEELHRARVMQPKPFSAEDIEFVNNLHKKTRS